MAWWDIPSAEETEIPKVPHEDHVDNFFESQGVVHKEFVPEGKTINAEFYKGVMDRLLKRIQRVRTAVFCSRDFFLLHDNGPAHKAASVCQFLAPKKLNPSLLPVLSTFISARLFLFPKLKMKLKGRYFTDVAEIQEAVADELKTFQKEEFSAAFQKLYDHATACIYANGAYFELKKKRYVSSIFKKKSVLQLLDRTVYKLAFKLEGGSQLIIQ